MKQINLDRAFPKTPDCIPSAIEMGFRKGRKQMKMRNKIVAMGSAAAAVIIMAAVAALAAGGLGTPPKPDVLAQPKVTDIPVLQEEIIIFTTENGAFYHSNSTCSGMENALEMTESEAISLGKQPCPACISLSCGGHDGEELELVYYAQGGKYFHKAETCPATAEGIFPVSGNYFAVINEFPGKQPCPDCLPDGVTSCLHRRAFVAKSEKPETTPEPQLNIADEATADEEYILLAADKESIQKPKSSETSIKNPVYYTPAGVYYHSFEHCKGMMNADAHFRYDAERSGKIGCPDCLMVYCTEGGEFYHLHPDCIGMLGASLRSIEEARAMGKSRCGICLSPATVYATAKGNYCHTDAECCGMLGAAEMTLDEAIIDCGKRVCPVCIYDYSDFSDSEASS